MQKLKENYEKYISNINKMSESIRNYVDHLEQKQISDKEFIGILIQNQAESAVLYNKVLTENKELYNAIKKLCKINTETHCDQHNCKDCYVTELLKQNQILENEIQNGCSRCAEDCSLSPVGAEYTTLKEQHKQMLELLESIYRGEDAMIGDFTKSDIEHTLQSIKNGGTLSNV